MTRPTLIIGAGIAGLWAALKRAPHPVILLSGAPMGEGAASGWAQGGIAAALSREDTAACHARDTIRAGAGLAATDAANALAHGAAQEVEALAALGVPFERGPDGWALSREAAHSRNRVARVRGDGAGAAIMQTLIAAMQSAGHIDVRNGWTALALLPGQSGGCAGALARSPDGRCHTIPASHTILATGGAGGLFAQTTTPGSAQGQAMAMSARLGAVIQDPEFVQFHPTALNTGQTPAPLCTEALRGEGAILVDRTGHRFMRTMHADAELAPRDVVARAVHRQIASGRGAYLDCRETIGDAFPDRFPAVYAACMAASIDPRVEPIPVAPAAHYHMGGVKTDMDGRTHIEGLWAIGECASSGLHGANRLASNSLAEGLVAAARCTHALTQTPPSGGKPGPIPAPPPSLPPLALHKLRDMMSRHCAVERNRAGLLSLRENIDGLRDRFGDADPLIAAAFMTEAALRRQESRGGHFRTDHPAPAKIAKHSRLALSDLQYRVSEPLPASLPAE